MKPELPGTIGRFEIQSLLGRGAMGVVYRGYDPEIDRTVAIKLVRADLLDGDERGSYLDRFRNEAKIAGRCMHANIVGIYDFALFEGNPYLVMEFVDGVGLNQAVGRGTKLSMPEAVHIALQVLDALDYAHRFGIVHRDIKPANILLTRHAKLKVTDFGISRLASTELTAAPLMIGTPSYMSPEQCAGDAIDGRSDLFSLGCILYELLAGERPFQGISYTETIFKLVNQPHESLSLHRPDLPASLSSILDRALAKRPEDRFENAEAFAHALRSVPPPSNAMPTAVSGMSVPAGADDDDLDTIIRPVAQAAMSVEPEIVQELAGPDEIPAIPPEQAGLLIDGSMPFDQAWLELDPLLVDAISRRLAVRVGPMARVYVRHSLRQAQSADMFCTLLSGGIPDLKERAQFLHEVQALLKPPEPKDPPPKPEPAVAVVPVIPAPPPQVLSLTEEDIQRTIAALAHVIGPIATQVVRRAVVRAHDRASLVTLCEAFVPQEAERTRFRTALNRSIIS
ncbi:MAG: serine/threonine-protein kinase [Janthinobacterium lividum]